jgi:hypothetical protein
MSTEKQNIYDSVNRNIVFLESSIIETEYDKWHPKYDISLWKDIHNSVWDCVVSSITDAVSDTVYKNLNEIKLL